MAGLSLPPPHLCTYGEPPRDPVACSVVVQPVVSSEALVSLLGLREGLRGGACGAPALAPGADDGEEPLDRSACPDRAEGCEGLGCAGCVCCAGAGVGMVSCDWSGLGRPQTVDRLQPKAVIQRSTAEIGLQELRPTATH